MINMYFTEKRQEKEKANSLIETKSPCFYELALGPFLRPKVATTLTNLLLYWMRLLARPVFFFFFSWASTLGVCPRTLPARAKEPWTLPPFSGSVTSTAQSAKSVTVI